MGPSTPPVPTTLAWEPMPLPRSSSGNTEVIIAIPVPCVMAAPSPCNALAPISANDAAGSYGKDGRYDEDDETGEKYPLAANDVGEPAHWQEERTDGQALLL